MVTLYMSQLHYLGSLLQSTVHAAQVTSHGLCAYMTRSEQRTFLVICAQATAANIKQVNAEELEAMIASRDKPIVVDFFATWCGPCLLLAQELEKVSRKRGLSLKNGQQPPCWKRPVAAHCGPATRLLK